MKRGLLDTSIVMGRKVLGGGMSACKFRALCRMGTAYLKVNLLKQPQIQYIEIMSTYRCNARCRHCSNSKYTWKDDRLLLTPEKIRDIIRQARGMKVPVICFLGGEPLMDERLPEYVRYTRDQGMLPMVASNGQLLDEALARTLKDAGVFSVAVTIYSTDPAENAAITGLPDYLETALANFRRAQALGIQMQLKCVVTRHHFESGEIHRVIDLARELDAWLSINPIVPTGGASDEHLDDVLDEPLQKELDALCAKLPFLTTHLTSNYFGYGCPAGKAYMGITPYGDVLACYFFPISFGNLWDTPLADIHARIIRTRVFREPYQGCFAAYSREAIDRAITPCFRDASLCDCLPVDVEKHPLYDEAQDVLALSV